MRRGAEETTSKILIGSALALAALSAGCGPFTAPRADRDAEAADEAAVVAEKEDLLWSSVLPGGDRVPEFAARRCNVRPNGAVQIRTTWAASEGDHPGDDGSRDETWTAGRLFGASGNTGYTNRDRTIVDGSPTSFQPGSLGCWQAGFLAIGWKFSNNVAGLTNTSLVHERTARRSAETHVTTRTELRGVRVDVYADPADKDLQDTASQVAQASRVEGAEELRRAYYDESAAGGTGLAWFRRQVRLGTVAAPMSYRVVRIHGSHPGTVLDAKLVSDRNAPLVETVIHSLGRGRPAVARTVHSGKFDLFYERARVRTEVSELRFARPFGDRRPPYPGACAARSGSMKHTIQGAWADQPGLVARVHESFGSGTHVFHVTCNQGLTGQACEKRGIAALKKFGPPACLF
jgi:hypothetical protein